MEKIRKLLVDLANWQFFGLAVLVLASVILHIAIITNPQETIFDEAHYVIDGRRILNGEGTERVEHPPVAKLFIVGGMKLFGDNPWGWRIPSLLVSTIGLVLFYNICRKLGGSHRVAFIATFLLVFENLSFLHAGMAMLDEFVAFFTILAFWFYLKGLERKASLFNEWWFFMAMAIALAALSKLSGILTAVPIGLHWLLAGYKRPEMEGRIEAGPPQGFWRRLGGVFYRYVYSLPFLMYALLTPLFFLGLMSCFDWIIWQRWINPVDQLQNMASMTNSIKFTGYSGPLPSRPWEWLLSPTNSFSLYKWMFSGAQTSVQILGYDWPPYGPHMTGMVSPTIFFTSLLAIPYIMWRSFKNIIYMLLLAVWFAGIWVIPTLLLGHVSSSIASVISFSWFAVPVIIYAVFFLIKKELREDKIALFVLCWLIGTWATWIPLSIISDRVSFSFYFLPTIPALCLAGALLLDRFLRFADGRHNEDFRGFTRGAVAFMVFFHLVLFCILGPINLPLSIPAALLVLAFTLDYLEYSWRTNLSAVVSIGAGVLMLRYFLYSYLEKWFGTETIVGLYPANPWFWVTGAAITLAVIAIAFFILRRLILRKRTVACCGCISRAMRGKKKNECWSACWACPVSILMLSCGGGTTTPTLPSTSTPPPTLLAAGAPSSPR
jgi:hypothetical protein